MTSAASGIAGAPGPASRDRLRRRPVADLARAWSPGRRPAGLSAAWLSSHLPGVHAPLAPAAVALLVALATLLLQSLVGRRPSAAVGDRAAVRRRDPGRGRRSPEPGRRWSDVSSTDGCERAIIARRAACCGSPRPAPSPATTSTGALGRSGQGDRQRLAGRSAGVGGRRRADASVGPSPRTRGWSWRWRWSVRRSSWRACRRSLPARCTRATAGAVVGGVIAAWPALLALIDDLRRKAGNDVLIP